MQRRRRSRQRFAPDTGAWRAFQKAETKPRSAFTLFWSAAHPAAGSPKKNLLEENAVSSLK